MSIQPLKTLLEEGLRDHLFSGYQLFTEHGGRALALQGGIHSYWGAPTPITPASFFDIGSVTKAVLTTSCIARGFDKQQGKLSDSLSDVLSEVRGTWLGSLKIEDLLRHQAGLVGWLPLYKTLLSCDWLEWLKNNQRLAQQSTREPEYSDLGFLLLGRVVEKRSGGLKDAYLGEVQGPLQLSEISFLKSVPAATAATEYCLWRHRLLQGEVFDENAAYFNVPCGHAGLFATARGLAPWAREWLGAYHGRSEWLTQSTARAFATRGPLSKNTWGLGWDTKSAEGSSAGTLLSEKSFGHLGFTGCSVWIDPQANGFVIFLTNRIHPSRWDSRIRQFRPRLHDEVARLWAQGGIG